MTETDLQGSIFYHPIGGKQLYGRRIAVAEMLLQSDMYDSTSGEWSNCPVPGIMVMEHFPSIWVRPLFRLYASQGQGGDSDRPDIEFKLLAEALAYCSVHHGEASYGIKYPNGDWHSWPTENTNDQFTITPDHLKLLRCMSVTWRDMEFGAPAIDPKYPYWDSDVYGSMGKILGLLSDDDEEFEYPVGLQRKLQKLHQEMQTVLQIVLITGTFEPGVYQKRNGFHARSWALVHKWGSALELAELKNWENSAPPEMYRNERFHWFHAERAGNPAIAEWLNGRWHLVGEVEPITPEQLRHRGWEYLGPVTNRPFSEYLDND